MTESKARELLDLALQRGRTTYWFTEYPPQKGYLVCYGRSGLMLSKDYIAPEIITTVSKHFGELGCDGLGIWVSQSWLHVDPVKCFATDLEAHLAAIAHSELAYYDIISKKVVYA